MNKSQEDKVKVRDIGVDVTPPGEKCDDPHCPFHGILSVRGAIIEGVVVSTRMQGTITVEREHSRYIPKYERFEKRTRRYFAHHPSCIKVKHGDIVKIMECRPLSKEVTFVVIERKG